MIGAISTVSIQVVQTLPVQDIQTNVIYLVPKTTAQTQNVYDEYIYVNNAWEKIGDTQIDLSEYARKPSSHTPNNIAKFDNDGNLLDSGCSIDTFVFHLTGSMMSSVGAGGRYAGIIVQCKESGSGYTEGYFYQSVLENGSYVWQQINVQPHQSLSGYQTTSNLVTTLSAQSTHSQYPSAKCVYDFVDNAIGNAESDLDAINDGLEELL